MIVNKKIKYAGKKFINKKNGIAARVPIVPGALLNSPVPKPKAKKAEKFLNSNSFAFKVIKPLFCNFV